MKLQPTSLNYIFFNFHKSGNYMRPAQWEIRCPLNRFAFTRILLK